MLVKKHITVHSFPAHAAVCDKIPIHPYNSQPTREHATNHATPHAKTWKIGKKHRVVSEIAAQKIGAPCGAMARNTSLTDLSAPPQA